VCLVQSPCFYSLTILYLFLNKQMMMMNQSLNFEVIISGYMAHYEHLTSQSCNGPDIATLLYASNHYDLIVKKWQRRKLKSKDNIPSANIRQSKNDYTEVIKQKMTDIKTNMVMYCIVYSFKNKLTVHNSKHENRTTAKTMVMASDIMQHISYRSCVMSDLQTSTAK